MRSLFFMLLLSCVGSQDIFSQGEQGVQPPHYIFEKFQMGKVLQKSGEVTEIALNYNTLTSEMIFYDGQRYMALASPEKVDTVYIAGRVFVPGDNKFYEVLTNTPLFEEYISTLKEGGNNIGYGLNSSTTSVTPLRSLLQSGQAYGLKLPDGYQVVSKQAYWIRCNGGLKPANNERQLSNIFPAKKAFINKWVKEKHADLSKREDLIDLVEAVGKE